jgi:NTE family protein
MALYDIVFEGGGAKGSAFVGALKALRERGHGHRRLIGTSAGAITAALLAAGYEPDEMLAAVNETLPDGQTPRFSSFMDMPAPDDFDDDMISRSVTMEIFHKVKFPFLPNWAWLDRRLLGALLANDHYRQLFSFVECGGLYAGDAFLAWLREKLDHVGRQRGNNVTADDTFEQFHAKTGKDLSLVATDTTDVEMLVLNHRTAPRLPVAWAVRMSMSIPFVWREVLWRKEWGTYSGDDRQRNDGLGNIIVDGGVLSNFPIKLIAVEPAHDPDVRRVMGDTPAGEALNLGLLIDENLEVPGAGTDSAPPKLAARLRTAQRVGRIIDTMMQAQDTSMIHQREHEVCRLPAKGYGTTEFKMEKPRLDALVRAGYEAMRAHLQKTNPGGG